MIIKNPLKTAHKYFEQIKCQYSLYFIKLVSGLKSICAFCLLLSLYGCSGFVAVDDKFEASTGLKKIHIVQKSETLFSLAWRYGWDYKALASANSIRPPFIIYPGQKLRVSRANRYVGNSKVTPSKSLTTSPKMSSKQVSAPPNIPVKRPVVAKVRHHLAWTWPAKGQLIARFSAKSPSNKGIDIGGRLGESVMAAAAGIVVYAGSGLLGYGNLVIIKHNEQFLSAYAHNKRLLVKENQQVKAGQSIALLGSSGTDKVKLHFEIRRQGKPVNPMLYLPKVKN